MTISLEEIDAKILESADAPLDDRALLYLYRAHILGAQIKLETLAAQLGVSMEEMQDAQARLSEKGFIERVRGGWGVPG